MRFLAFLLLLGATLPAQTFQASLLAGINLAQVEGDDLLGFHQPGLNAGARVVAVLGEHWRVGPELLFNQQGARRTRNTTTNSSLDRIRLTTVALPLMAYYRQHSLEAGAGLSYQRLIDYRLTDRRGNDVTDTETLRSDGLALHLDASLYFSERLGFNFRWSRYLTDLQEGTGPRFVPRSLDLRFLYTL